MVCRGGHDGAGGCCIGWGYGILGGDTVYWILLLLGGVVYVYVYQTLCAPCLACVCSTIYYSVACMLHVCALCDIHPHPQPTPTLQPHTSTHTLLRQSGGLGHRRIQSTLCCHCSGVLPGLRDQQQHKRSWQPIYGTGGACGDRAWCVCGEWGWLAERQGWQQGVCVWMGGGWGWVCEREHVWVRGSMCVGESKRVAL